jgi:D-inositol-3-phosphate glycosyltransferase
MSRPFTIAMLSIHSSPIGTLGTRDTGGMSVYVRALAREMGRTGHRVDIFTRARHDHVSAVMRLSANVRLVTLDIGATAPLAKADLYRYADDYATAIDAFKTDARSRYDLIHSHYWLSGLVGQMLAKRWPCPHLITFHTLAALKTNTGTGTPSPDRRLQTERKLVQESDAILAPCQTEIDNLIRFYGAPSDRIRQVPGGVDFVHFRPRSRAAACRELGFDPEDFILLSVGRLTPLKGQARLIETLARLGNDDRLKLVLVGGEGPGDSEQQRLEQMAAQAGVAARVVFSGSVPHRNLPTYYAAADVYVQASHYESFGLVGLEALACGRPVVTSPVGVMASLGERGQTGCILTDGSPGAMAAAIAAVRDGTRAWPPAAIHAAVREFNWPQAATNALEAYAQTIHRDLPNGRKNPGCEAAPVAPLCPQRPSQP